MASNLVAPAALIKPAENSDTVNSDTVGAVAAHVSEGYHNLGQLLRVAGGPQGSPQVAGRAHSRGPPAALPDLLKRLTDSNAPISLLPTLTAEQVDRVLPRIPHISDGHRTLKRVIDDVIDH